MILDDGSDATVLIHKGTEYENAGKVPAVEIQRHHSYLVVRLSTQNIRDCKELPCSLFSILLIFEPYVINPAFKYLYDVCLLSCNQLLCALPCYTVPEPYKKLTGD